MIAALWAATLNDDLADAKSGTAISASRMKPQFWGFFISFLAQPLLFLVP
jgi:hypothetical protein